MGLLSDIYSYGDGLKRKLGGLLSDPGGTVGLGITRMGEDQDGLRNLMRNAYPRSGDNTVLNTPQQRGMFRAELANKAADMGSGLLGGATVWHGSPHKFDRFDSSKIGTGEGAQAYGHGLYLSESPEVAKTYLAGPTAVNTQWGAIEKDIRKNLRDEFGVGNYKIRNGEIHTKGGDGMWMFKGYAPQGNLYKADLPDEHIAKMLDWDKPLSEQPEVVRATIGKLPKGWVTGAGGERRFIDPSRSQRTGAGLLEELQMLRRGQPEEMLRSAGIPGIRYLDGQSRGAGGTSNYVVFPGNEGLLQILERNGAPLK